MLERADTLCASLKVPHSPTPRMHVPRAPLLLTPFTPQVTCLALPSSPLPHRAFLLRPLSSYSSSPVASPFSSLPDLSQHTQVPHSQ